KPIVHRWKQLLDSNVVAPFVDQTAPVFRSSPVTFEPDTLPRTMQNDGYSCGVFVCLYATAVATGSPLHFRNDTGSLKKYRCHIWQVIQNYSQGGSQATCSTCNRMVPDACARNRTIDWIECPSCLNWYHDKCVASGPTDTFICSSCQNLFSI
uniref:ULP_PROTEASE domain-containing protein n=1 Tax=Macrostomum lignano TaxID=282301 RepID=A0A1I8HHF3_9PLAT